MDLGFLIYNWRVGVFGYFRMELVFVFDRGGVSSFLGLVLQIFGVLVFVCS